MAAAKRGPHVSALAPDAIAMMHTEVEAKVKEGFAEVVYLDEIEDLLETEEYSELKISPLAMVPHKSRKFRAILDLSFRLKLLGMDIPSVNEATNITAPQHSMRNLGSVLPRLIAAVAAAPLSDGAMVFSKLDIKDGFWRMIVQHGHHLNFAYVLPDVKGARIRLVIPSSLQMGWTESPPFFCSATETARDVADELIKEPLGSLAPHPLEHHMLPPAMWPEHKLGATCARFLKVLEVYVDDFCSMVQTSDVAHLRHVPRSLLHAIHSVFPPPDVTGHKGGDPVSLKKLLEGEGTWDVRKEILGWVFDGARRCIELPPKKLDDIVGEIKAILRLPTIPFKRFEKIVGKLRHAAIGLPAGKGLCAPFNQTIAIHPLRVALGPKGLVRPAFQDWLRLLADMRARPSHVNELVGQPIADVGNMDASKVGAGGVWFSTESCYPPTVWRLEWPPDVWILLVSDRNPKGSITNSDLEMAAILIQWLVLEHITITMHRSALARSDNTPACSWATKMSPKSRISARLVRALALRQRICQAAPMYTIHVAGKANDIADIPSRSFRDSHRWNCPSDEQFLCRFASHFQLPQGHQWQLFQVNPKITTRVIDELLQRPMPMDVWHRLPPIGRLFGRNDVLTSAPATSTLGSTSRQLHSTPSSNTCPVLLDGLGKATSVEAIKSLVRGCKQLSVPSARHVSWHEDTTLCTVPPTSTSNP